MPCHKRDWKQYNRQLIQRGNLNFWITKEAIKLWLSKKSKKPGKPFTYSDEAIRVMLVVRFKFQLSFRALQGLFFSLKQALKIPKIPSYTQVCRRMKSLSLPEKLVDRKKITDLVLDTTGLKVYGEGEWCAKKYGGSNKWLKLHIGMDPKEGKIVFSKITQETVHDTAYLEEAVQCMNRKKGKVLMDGIADSKRCYELCRKYNKTLLTPPSRNAILRQEPEYGTRNEALKTIRGLGGDELARSIWGKLSGYSRRSEVESMISRWKRLLGGKLQSRSKDRIKREVQIKSMILNEMLGLREAS